MMDLNISLFPFRELGFLVWAQKRNQLHREVNQLFASELNGSLEMVNEFDGVNGYMSASASNYEDSEGRLSFYDMEETHEQVFSPPFLMDASLSAESFEDLLAPLSETETESMEF